jgi:hypothetical protein
MATQLKVENPQPLRTIRDLAFRARVIAAGQCSFTHKIRLKMQNRRSGSDDDTNVARKKSAQPGGKTFIDERAAGVQLRKRQ